MGRLIAEHQMDDKFNPAKAEQELRRIVTDIKSEIEESDDEFRSLYNNPSSPDCAVPFFGKVPSARYLTVSPNPSAHDAGAPPRACDLAQHCLDYFSRGTFQPHHFFHDGESGLRNLV